MPLDAIKFLSFQPSSLREVWEFPGGSRGKEPICQCRRFERRQFDPWVGKIPGEEHGNPLQYSYLENPTVRGAWRATVHKVTESDTTEET